MRQEGQEAGTFNIITFWPVEAMTRTVHVSRRMLDQARENEMPHSPKIAVAMVLSGTRAEHRIRGSVIARQCQAPWSSQLPIPSVPRREELLASADPSQRLGTAVSRALHGKLCCPYKAGSC